MIDGFLSSFQFLVQFMKLVDPTELIQFSVIRQATANSGFFSEFFFVVVVLCSFFSFCTFSCS